MYRVLFYPEHGEWTNPSLRSRAMLAGEYEFIAVNREFGMATIQVLCCESQI